MSVKIFPNVYQSLYAQNFARKHLYNEIVRQKDKLLGEQKLFAEKYHKQGGMYNVATIQKNNLLNDIAANYWTTYRYSSSENKFYVKTYNASDSMFLDLKSKNYKYVKPYTSYVYFKSGKLKYITAESAKKQNENFGKNIKNQMGIITKIDNALYQLPNKIEIVLEDDTIYTYTTFDFVPEFFTKKYFIQELDFKLKEAGLKYNVKNNFYEYNLPHFSDYSTEEAIEPIQVDGNYTIILYTPDPFYEKPTVRATVKDEDFIYEFEGEFNPVLDTLEFAEEFTKNSLLGHILEQSLKERPILPYRTKTEKKKLATEKIVATETEKRKKIMRSLSATSLKTGKSVKEILKEQKEGIFGSLLPAKELKYIEKKMEEEKIELGIEEGFIPITSPTITLKPKLEKIKSGILERKNIPTAMKKDNSLIGTTYTTILSREGEIDTQITVSESTYFSSKNPNRMLAAIYNDYVTRVNNALKSRAQQFNKTKNLHTFFETYFNKNYVSNGTIPTDISKIFTSTEDEKEIIKYYKELYIYTKKNDL